MRVIKVVISAIFLLLAASCQKTEHSSEVDQVVQCAFDELTGIIDFEERFFDRNNYFAWKLEGFSANRHMRALNEGLKWDDLDYIEIETDRIVDLLNHSFLQDHKLQLLSILDLHDKVAFEKKETFCAWSFGGMKKHKNRYYLEVGFAVGSKWGAGGNIVIDWISKDSCQVVEFHPAIM